MCAEKETPTARLASGQLRQPRPRQGKREGSSGDFLTPKPRTAERLGVELASLYGFTRTVPGWLIQSQEGIQSQTGSVWKGNRFDTPRIDLPASAAADLLETTVALDSLTLTRRQFRYIASLKYSFSRKRQPAMKHIKTLWLMVGLLGLASVKGFGMSRV